MLIISIYSGNIDEPRNCPNCQAVGTLEMIHNRYFLCVVYFLHCYCYFDIYRSVYSDKQSIRIQETPDEVPEGETPFNLTAFAYDDLVDTVRPVSYS